MKLKDKKIRIVHQNSAKDSEGFTDNSWKPIHDGTLWAYYRQLSGKEIHTGGATVPIEDTIFTINWRNDVSPSMCVCYNGRRYNIVRVDTFEGYKNDISLYCKTAGYV